ncbi:MAG: protein kinase, partial [Verrucomicrobiota bacterium]
MKPLTVEEIVPGLTLGHFQIQEEISRGGMGVVFKALEPDLNRVVALKVLASKYAQDPEYVKSFQEEAKLVASLRHPHVIPIYYIGQIGEVVFYSMAYIPNPSLDHWIQEGHRLDLREVKWFLTQSCSALDCATKEGLIHLDIKPSNFLVDENGQQVSADIVLLLLAKHFLSVNPGMGVVYNLICSRSVPEFVKKWGGVPIRTQVGFVNVREGLIKNNGIMGGELSAHYCFKDYWCMDSGMIAFLTLLQ